MRGHDHHEGWIAWFIQNPVAANLLMIILLIVGGLTLIDMRTEGFPEPSPRTVSINVLFAGGSPEDVEEGAAIKIEQALKGIEGVRRISSTVTDSKATISVQAKDGYLISTLKDNIKIRVDAISTFPAQIESVIITEEQEERHVMSVQIFGDANHATLKKTAKRVRDRLLALPEVNKITIEGARAFEIHVEIQEEKLRAYGLSFNEVAAAIRKASINLSAGELKTSGGTVTLQSRKQRYHGNEFENIIVRSSSEGGLIRIADVAIVRDGYADQSILSRFQGKPSINLNIQLLGRDSVTQASHAVIRVIGQIREENWLPETIELTTWADEADNIRERLGLFSKNALLGMILVLVMLTLFLNPKIAFWVALGIPISFAGTFIVMGPNILDYSINDLTNFAFIVVLGIVVDDAIIIGENVFTHKKRNGNGIEATIRGTKEVATSATFGVLTTVAAFFPLAIMTGDFGGPFRMIAIVTIVCLFFSLVESKFILPAHLAPLDVQNKKMGEQNKVIQILNSLQMRIDQALQRFIKQYYQPLITTVLSYRYQSLGVFIAIFILAIGLVTSGLVRTVFFGDDNESIIHAKATMKSGTPAAKTHEVANYIETHLHETNNILKHQYSLDTNPVIYSYVSSQEDETATVTAQITPGSQRPFYSQELLDLWRKKVGAIVNAKELNFYDDDDDDGLSVQVSSSDHMALEEATKILQDRVKAYVGIFDIRTNLDNDTLELAIELKPEAQILKLSYHDVINQLRNAVFGFEAQRIQRGDEEVRVIVRYPRDERNDISDLQNMRILTADSGTVPFSQVVNITRTKKQAELTRIDGNRVLTLTAQIDEDIVSSSDIIAAIENKVFPDIKKLFPGISIELTGDHKRENEATTKLMTGFVLGLFLIYGLLAIPLKSYSQPFVIMLAIPFGIIGAILGHLIVGIPLSFVSFFGILALSGVVVNDSLVLVSRYNQIRKRNLSDEDAIIETGMSRFRAVFLTSITTFVGLFPLILETSEQAQRLIPMAVSLAFGILFSTIITLLVIPVLLSIRLNIIEVLSPLAILKKQET